MTVRGCLEACFKDVPELAVVASCFVVRTLDGGRGRLDVLGVLRGHRGGVGQKLSTMAETRQYGDLATQLVLEARRSTANDLLLKYNGELVRSIIREQRELDKLADSPDVSPALLIFQTAILRNKRCLLAYHKHRLDRLRDMYWAVGGALPHLLSNPDIRSKLSPHEVDFLREYSASVMDYRAGFSNELDITASITHPPKDLHVLVRVVRDCGVIQTELGSIDFQKGQRFMVRRADIEHLIVQGYLEQV